MPFTSNTFVVYPEQVHGGWMEVIQQNLDVFNAASRGGITQVSEGLRGHFNAESFSLRLATGVQRRDTNSTADLTPDDVLMDEVIGTKLARTLFVQKTLDAWKKVQLDSGISDDQLLSFHIGQSVAQEFLADWVNTAMVGAVGAMAAEAEIFLPLVANEMASTRKLNQGLKLLGDARNNVVCWVGNGITYADLVDQNISDNVQDLTGAVMYGGSVGTLGKPFLVTDSPALTNVGGGTTGDSYYILGLHAGGITLTESENRSVSSGVERGKVNLLGELQIETSFSLKLMGMKWNSAVENPDNTALGNGTNWTKVATSHKNLPGVIIEVDNK